MTPRHPVWLIPGETCLTLLSLYPATPENLATFAETDASWHRLIGGAGRDSLKMKLQTCLHHNADLIYGKPKQNHQRNVQDYLKVGAVSTE